MGSLIELNDTLKLNAAQGFPGDVLDLARHVKDPIKAESLKDRIFAFTKGDARLYQRDPIRNFLVQDMGGKWLWWGHAMIISQCIEKQLEADGTWDEKKKKWQTSGTYRISRIYDPQYQEAVTKNESPPGKSYF